MTTPTDIPMPPTGRSPRAARSVFFTRRDHSVQTPRVARRALTASASRLDLTAGVSNATRRVRDGWQDQAWAYRDDIGEIRYATTFLANVASRMRLFPAVATAEGDDPVPVDEAVELGLLDQGLAADAKELIERLSGGRAHAGRLLGPLAEQLEIVGESMLVGRLIEDGTERWQVYSTDEVKHDDKGWYLATEGVTSPTEADRLDPGLSYVARLWRPHPRYSQRADSPMRALLDVAEELLRVGRAIRAELRSRVHAGILYVNNDVVNAARVNTDVEDTDGPPALIVDLADSLTAAALDESALETLVPTMLTGQLPFSEAVGHLSLARTIDGSLADRQTAALSRLAMGLDIPPEIITGLADSNHWSAWQISDDTFRNHVEPLVQLMVDAITVSMFRGGLLELGHSALEVERLIVWYDPSDAVTAPNRGAEADAAWDRGAISDAAYRTARGFNDGDEPDDAERVRRLVWARGTIDASITTAVLQAIAGAGVSIPEPQPALPAPDPVPAPAPEAPVTPEDTAPATPGPEEIPGEPAAVTASAGDDDRAARLSRQLADIDRSLRDRLHVAADMALQHALESAGRKVRTAAGRKDRGLYASLQDVPSAAVTAAAGREAITAALGLDEQQLLASALDVLAGQWTAWVGVAAGQVVDLVAELAGWRDDDPRRQSLATSLAAGAVAGWSWLAQRLDDLAASLLYDPADPDAEPVERSVPYSVVRGAVAVAGGLDPASGGVTDRGLPGRVGQLVGGLATGTHAAGALAASGVTDEGYEWVYGVSSNPFQPHRRMDGRRFASFNDPALAPPADADWLGPIMLPGDHDGCRCSYVVLYSVPDGEPVSPELQAQVEALPPPALARLRAQATADIAAGRYDTDTVRQVVEAERQANARPSQPTSPTPTTDAVRRSRGGAR